MVLCIACQVDIAQESLRDHFKSEWHCYNLKRKIVDLPPVTQNDFECKLKQISKTDDGNISKIQSLYCEICKKKFSKKNSYDQHIQSKAHLSLISQCTRANTSEKDNSEPALVSNPAIKVDDDNDDDDVWEDCEPLGMEECLFCSHISNSLDANLEHMAVKHSFFLPETDYLISSEGLINYLDEKVGVGNMCLWCQRQFESVKSVQQHMQDKGHTKLFCDGEAALEYADFYDFSNDDSSVEIDDLTEATDEDYELRLPSGACIGHRSLWRYFRQSVPPEKTVALRSGQKSTSSKLSAAYRSIGWSGSTKSDVELRARDIAYLQRQKNKNYMKLGVKANKFQKHYREQVIF